MYILTYLVLAVLFMVLALAAEYFAFVSIGTAWFWYDLGIAAIGVALGFFYKHRAEKEIEKLNKEKDNESRGL
jgi:hypothetical protein